MHQVLSQSSQCTPGLLANPKTQRPLKLQLKP